jgi:hypothetical protein
LFVNDSELNEQRAAIAANGSAESLAVGCPRLGESRTIGQNAASTQGASATQGCKKVAHATRNRGNIRKLSPSSGNSLCRTDIAEGFIWQRSLKVTPMVWWFSRSIQIESRGIGSFRKTRRLDAFSAIYDTSSEPRHN